MASLTKMNNNNMVSNSSEEEKKKAALKLDVPKQDGEKLLLNVGPPIKPSFIDYSLDRFKYNGPIDKFIEAMEKLSKEIPFDFKYNNLSNIVYYLSSKIY